MQTSLTDKTVSLIPDKHEQLDNLHTYFRINEKETLSKLESPPDKFLCFRLDGVNTSKNFLKDRIVYKLFNERFCSAVITVYHLLRKYTQKEFRNFFLCAFVHSDEVSFVLNQGKNNYDNRLFKIGSILSGTLSSAMTLQIQIKNKKKMKIEGHPNVMSFDSRPLILDDYSEVKKYIRYRWLMGCRNAMCKVLRLKSNLSDEDIFETDLNHDFKMLSKYIKEYDLVEHYNDITSNFFLFVPDEEKGFIKYDSSAISDITEQYKYLDDFLFSKV